MCVYVCQRIPTYACVWRMPTYAHECLYTTMYVYVCLCMLIYTTHVSVPLCMHVCMNGCMDGCVDRCGTVLEGIINQCMAKLCCVVLSSVTHFFVLLSVMLCCAVLCCIVCLLYSMLCYTTICFRLCYVLCDVVRVLCSVCFYLNSSLIICIYLYIFIYVI